MDEDTFIKIIKELQDNRFYYKEDKFAKNYISFNRFSEPMYNIDLLKKRLNQAIEIMPKADYVINTNGDYLSNEALKDLHLDQLNIMDYDCKGKDYWIKKLQELDVLVFGVNERNIIYGVHKNINKVSVVLNWPLNVEIEDRAGFLKKDIYYNGTQVKWKENKAIRILHCIEPSKYVSIDYNGNVMPCCHMRSDNPEHEKFILGNVKNQTLVEVLNSNKANIFRNIMVSGDINNYPEECMYCQKTREITYEADLSKMLKI